MPNQTKTEGTLLQRGDGATPTEAFTTIAGVQSIDPPEKSAEEVDQTQLTSAVRKSRASAIPEPGELSVTYFDDPEDAQHQGLEDGVGGAAGNWRLVYNDGTSSRPHHQFSGWIKSHKREGIDPDSGDLLASIVIKLTSAITRGTTTV